jgi:hypothetical protein
MILPKKERMIPMMTSAGCFSLKKRYENNPTKMGFVATRTTLLATDVNFSELIQKKKWRERKNPPSIPKRICLLLYDEMRIPLLFAISIKMIEERVSR